MKNSLNERVLARRERGYIRSREPWRMDDEDERRKSEQEHDKAVCRVLRLFTRDRASFGEQTVREAEREARQNHAFAGFAVLGIVWLVFWIF